MCRKSKMGEKRNKGYKSKVGDKGEKSAEKGAGTPLHFGICGVSGQNTKDGNQPMSKQCEN